MLLKNIFISLVRRLNLGIFHNAVIPACPEFFLVFKKDSRCALLAGMTMLMVLLMSTEALCDNKGLLLRENQLLESEFKLATKPDIYFIFNLKDNKIYIKAAGTLLREMQIKGVKKWGDHAPGQQLLLLKKSTFIKPGREKIKPGETKAEDDFSIEALELRDMPARYMLSMDKGVSIFVRPETEGIFSGLLNLFYSAKRFISRPALSLWNALLKRPFAAIDIILDKKDAQALYWSFYEGNGAIVYSP